MVIPPMGLFRQGISLFKIQKIIGEKIMIKNIFRFSLILVLLFSLSIYSINCSNDDDDEDIGEHIQPWGFVLYDSGVEVARYFQGELTDESEIHVHEGEMTGHIAVYFIDKDGNEYDPLEKDELNGGHHSLELTIDNTDVAEIWRHDQGEGEDWGFHVVGNEEGEAGLQLALVHEDHYGFVMPDDVWVPIHVEHGGGGEHGPPVGLVVKNEESGEVLAISTADSVDGQINVPLGDHTDHLEVEFFDANDVHFHPDVPVHSLAGAIADTTIAQFESHAGDGEPWSFWIHGLQAGDTTLELDLMHDDHIGWGAALAIPVHVE
jgi:hypothetical protein